MNFKKYLKIGILVTLSTMYTQAIQGNERNEETEQRTTFTTFATFQNENIPQTEEQYIEKLTEIWAIYNRIAPMMWHNNKLIDAPILAFSNTNRDLFWWIEPTGEITEITKEEVSLKIPNSDFSEEDELWYFSYGATFSTETIPLGLYHLVEFNTEDVATSGTREFNNQGQFYIGQGTILSPEVLIHSGFHMSTQRLNIYINEENHHVLNMSHHRYAYLLETEARLLRRLMFSQAVDALANPEDTNYILTLLSTYTYYRENFKHDHIYTSFFENWEGIVQWFHMMSVMAAFHYDEIQTIEDQQAALSYLAKYHSEDTWLSNVLDKNEYLGMSQESYWISMVTTALVDLHMDRVQWQQLLETSDIHSFGILLNIFEDYEIPQFEHEFSEEERTKFDSLREDSNVSLQSFLRLLERTLELETTEIEKLIPFIEDEEILEAIENGIPRLLYNVNLTRKQTVELIHELTGISLEVENVENIETEENTNEQLLTIGEAIELVELSKNQSQQPSQHNWWDAEFNFSNVPRTR